jgi:mRNA interferase HicA
MKRRELIKLLTDAKCVFKRPGGRHDLYFNPQNGRSAPVPRHNEVKRTLVEQIKKQLGI